MTNSITPPRADDPPPAPSHDPADQLAEIAAATGGLAHEIRNPLSTMRVNMQLLAEDWREIAEGRVDRPSEIGAISRRSVQRIESLTREIDRLSSFLEDFLRFIGKDELTLVNADLNELLAEIAEFFEPQAAAAGIRLALQPDAAPLHGRVDPNLLKQALLNLLLNAQQAMPHGGQLTLRARRRDNHAVVEVHDTGPGIAPDVLRRIFDPYFSTRKGGTGLGLPTARRIITKHGGTLTVDSAVGQGSCFVVQLPLADATAPRRP